VSGLNDTDATLRVLQPDQGAAAQGIPENPNLSRLDGHKYSARDITSKCREVRSCTIQEYEDYKRILGPMRDAAATPGWASRFSFADLRWFGSKDTKVCPERVVLQAITVYTRARDWPIFVTLAIGALLSALIGGLVSTSVFADELAWLTFWAMWFGIALVVAALLLTRKSTYLVMPALITALALKHPEPGGSTMAIMESHVTALAHRALLDSTKTAAVVRDSVEFWYKYGDRAFRAGRTALLSGMAGHETLPRDEAKQSWRVELTTVAAFSAVAMVFCAVLVYHRV